MFQQKNYLRPSKLPKQATENYFNIINKNSYSDLLFLSMVSSTSSTNYSSFFTIGWLNISADCCYQIRSNCDVKSITRIFLVTRPTYQTRKKRCLLQGLKFSNQCKAASEAIVFVISRLIFFDKRRICHSMFSLTSGVHT